MADGTPAGAPEYARIASSPAIKSFQLIRSLPGWSLLREAMTWQPDQPGTHDLPYLAYLDMHRSRHAQTIASNLEIWAPGRLESLADEELEERVQFVACCCLRALCAGKESSSCCVHEHADQQIPANHHSGSMHRSCSIQRKHTRQHARAALAQSVSLSR
jgi:hypothetical protein